MSDERLTCRGCGAGAGEWHTFRCEVDRRHGAVFMPDDETGVAMGKNEVDELGELLQAAALVTRAVVEEVRAAGVLPPVQMSRAHALHEAREWVEHVEGVGLFSPERLGGAHAQATVEALADRWAAWIESGVFGDA